MKADVSIQSSNTVLTNPPLNNSPKALEDQLKLIKKIIIVINSNNKNKNNNNNKNSSPYHNNNNKERTNRSNSAVEKKIHECQID